MAEHNEIGKIGEKLARTFLMKQGFSIIDTNYATKYGELDIIAEKDTIIRFVEVKTIKVRGFDGLDSLTIRPEDNLTSDKWRKIVISVETYLNHHKKYANGKFQIDLACVYLDTEREEGRVKIIPNIHME